MADITAPVKPTADVTPAPATQPVVHRKNKHVKNDAKTAEVATPAVADRAAVSSLAATTNVVASIPAGKSADTVKTK